MSVSMTTTGPSDSVPEDSLGDLAEPNRSAVAPTRRRSPTWRWQPVPSCATLTARELGWTGLRGRLSGVDRW